MCVQDRISKLITYKGLNKSSFSKAIKIQPQTLHHIVAGRRTNPSFEIIQKIITKFPDVNPVWLITGVGEMTLIQTESKETEDTNSEKGQKIYDCDNELFHNAEENVLTYSKAAVSLIPIVDLAVATQPASGEKSSRNLTDKLCFPTTIVKKNRDYRCVRIKDESMMPSLTENTYLIVVQIDPSDWPGLVDNDIYMIADNQGNTFVRRVKRLSAEGLYACQSDNTDKLRYPDITLSPQQIASIWHAEWFLSTRTPGSGDAYSQRLTQVEDKLEQMQNELSKLNRKKRAD